MARHQLPAYSPLRLDDVIAAALRGSDPREPLRARLQAQFKADALLVGSGTIALGLALQAAARRRPRLPVAMPGYACYDLATAALMADVPVVLYDLDPQTLSPEPASLASVCAGGVAAIVAVHLYGVPVDLAPLRALAEQHDALLIEDAAQGVGASLAGAALGARGDFGILSFGRGKGHTGGVGGALLAQEKGVGALEALEHTSSRARATATGTTLPEASVGAAFYAKLLAQWMLGRPSLYGIPARIPALRLGETLFHPPGPATAMPAAASLIVSRTFQRALDEADVRRRNAERLLSAIATSGLQRVSAPADAVSGWLRLPLLLPERHRPHARSDAALGVMPGYPRPLRELPALQPLVRGTAQTPGADSLAVNLWTLPTHSLLSDADLVALEGWLRDAAR